MAVYDYRPIWAGAYCDPGPDGGSVDRIDLYTGPERTGTAAATAGPAVRVREGIYRFTLPEVPDGRYWCVITVTPAKGQPAATNRMAVVDLPQGTGLVASAESVADELGVTLPLNAAQRERYWRAISKAQADVLAYIGRPLIPTFARLTKVLPKYGHALDDPRAWPVQDDDVLTVASYTAHVDGTYDVEFLVGIDGTDEEPIVRYVVTHAAESLRNAPTAEADGGRRISSLSAEGQSISYDAAPIPGQAGAPPTLDSLSSYRRRVFRPARTVAATPWPYGGARRYRRW
ncbi:hypothetical protein ABZ726_00210 [Streptomyces hundungensis]|uniref:hypothetical protein n=1 Tax=Streptomyces hundungensis TaxID=1077946 RepID=UPI00340DB419